MIVRGNLNNNDWLALTNWRDCLSQTLKDHPFTWSNGWTMRAQLPPEITALDAETEIGGTDHKATR